jgi:hypothetical protein
MVRPFRILLLSLVCIAAIGAIPASAQDPDEEPEHRPIPRFAADVRGLFSKYYDDPAIATFLEVTQANVPTRGLGFVAGGHVYPFRMGRITLGVGGEIFFSRGRKSIKVKSTDDPPKEIDGPTVGAWFDGFTPQVSLNFGRRAGWSYVSIGTGWTKYRTEIVETPTTGTIVGPTPPVNPVTPPETDKVRTLNYGGGARWFFKTHLAFCFDIRYWTVNPQVEAETHPALPRKRLVMASAGVSFR